MGTSKLPSSPMPPSTATATPTQGCWWPISDCVSSLPPPPPRPPSAGVSAMPPVSPVSSLLHSTVDGARKTRCEDLLAADFGFAPTPSSRLSSSTRGPSRRQLRLPPDSFLPSEFFGAAAAGVPVDQDAYTIMVLEMVSEADLGFPPTPSSRPSSSTRGPSRRRPQLPPDSFLPSELFDAAVAGFPVNQDAYTIMVLEMVCRRWWHYMSARLMALVVLDECLTTYGGAAIKGNGVEVVMEEGFGWRRGGSEVVTAR